MESINPIESLIDLLITTSQKPVQAVNSNKQRENCILIRMTRAEVTISDEKKVSFRCQCEAYVKGRAELNVIGALSEAIKNSEYQEGDTIQRIEGISKNETISMFGEGQIETALQFVYYLETSYNETIVPLTGIQWEIN